jgi:aspartyl-tRNA(Asn)/glutamyl-tRNA(Gln) amidotransferase subunit B
MAANWVINELFGRLNKEGKDIADSPISASSLGAIIRHDQGNTISGKIAKDVFEIVWTEGGDPADRRRPRHEAGHRHRRHRGDRRRRSSRPTRTRSNRPRKSRSCVGWFVGQVMKATGGKANPQAVNDLLKQNFRGLFCFWVKQQLTAPILLGMRLRPSQ